MAQCVLLAKTWKTTLLEQLFKAKHFQELSSFLQITQGVLVFLLCPLQAFFRLLAFCLLVFHPLVYLPLVYLPQVFYPLAFYPLAFHPLVCHLLVFYLLVFRLLVYLPLVFFQGETTISERNSFRSKLYFWDIWNLDKDFLCLYVMFLFKPQGPFYMCILLNISHSLWSL